MGDKGVCLLWLRKHGKGYLKSEGSKDLREYLVKEHQSSDFEAQNHLFVVRENMLREF